VPDPNVKHAPDTLHGQSVPKRMAIVAAGPIANFVLAILIFAVFFNIYGMSYSRPKVDEVLPGSAAEMAGIKAGDVVLSINNKPIESFEDIVEIVVFRPSEKMVMEIDRSGEKLSITATPVLKEISDNFGGTTQIGQLGVSNKMTADEPIYQKLAPHQALVRAVDQVWTISTTTLRELGLILIGERSHKQIGGAATMGKVAGDAASAGPAQFMFAIAFLSIAIGLVNLFPIPMLDGGHLTFYAIEAVRGKPLGPVAQEWGYRIGFACVIMLILLGNFNDLGRLFNLAFKT
jgi:regulator of sigma E protease